MSDVVVVPEVRTFQLRSGIHPYECLGLYEERTGLTLRVVPHKVWRRKAKADRSKPLFYFTYNFHGLVNLLKDMEFKKAFPGSELVLHNIKFTLRAIDSEGHEEVLGTLTVFSRRSPSERRGQALRGGIEGGAGDYQGFDLRRPRSIPNWLQASIEDCRRHFASRELSYSALGSPPLTPDQSDEERPPSPGEKRSMPSPQLSTAAATCKRARRECADRPLSYPSAAAPSFTSMFNVPNLTYSIHQGPSSVSDWTSTLPYFSLQELNATAPPYQLQGESWQHPELPLALPTSYGLQEAWTQEDSEGFVEHQGSINLPSVANSDDVYTAYEEPPIALPTAPPAPSVISHPQRVAAFLRPSDPPENSAEYSSLRYPIYDLEQYLLGSSSPGQLESMSFPPSSESLDGSSFSGDPAFNLFQSLLRDIDSDFSELKLPF